MEHSVIESLLFWQDPETGNVIASDKAAPLTVGAVVFGPTLPVATPFFNLLVAAPMLYQQLSLQYNGLQSLLDLIDALPQTAELSQLSNMLTQLQNGCLLAHRVAQVGINEVAKSLDSSSNPS
jgi:hypothetical protein